MSAIRPHDGCEMSGQASKLAEQQAEPPTVFKNGYPSVARFSAMIDYLDLCAVGVSIRSDTLDCNLVKASDDAWSGYDDERNLSCIEVVEELRFVLLENDKDYPVDKIYVHIEPIDKVAIKKEVAADRDEEEDEEPG